MTRHYAMTKKDRPVIWILVADGKQARMYDYVLEEKVVPLHGNAHHPHMDTLRVHEVVPLPGMAWEAESPEIYETGRNATGMVFGSGGSTRHMAEPHVDARKEVKHHFALLLAERVNVARAKKQFDRLVVAAPPRLLGELRGCFSDDVSTAIVVELPKELTKCDHASLREHVEKALATTLK